MKLQKLSLLAGIVALSLTAVPFAVKAQTISSSPLVVAQEVPGKGPFQRLGLSDEQKAQIAEIRRNSQAEIEKILTPEQRQQLEQLKAERQNRQGNRQGRRNKFASLNLTEEQRTQIQQIMQSRKSQIESVLTPEQKQQLQQYRENMRSRRQQNNPNR